MAGFDMTRNQQVLVSVAVAAVGVIIFLTRKAMPYGAAQPRKQGADIAGTYSDILPDPQGRHFIPPNDLLGPAVVLPQRFPAFAGQDLTVLIHQGFAPLSRPRPQDYDWLTQPPSEDTL